MVLSFIVIFVHIPSIVNAPTIWYVDDEAGGIPDENFTSIQEAINAAQPGDTVYVYNGTYNENVIVNKTINLTGENRENTIIDGGGSGDVVRIEANWTNLEGFKIKGSGLDIHDAGLELNSVHHCNVSDINVVNNFNGIYLFGSINEVHHCNISYNKMLPIT
jgi:nitrous oxidase accessory protein NosD